MKTALERIKLNKDSNTPLYLALKDELVGLIRGSVIKPGQRFYSYRKIAEAADVSRITAQLAVKALIDEGILEQDSKRGIIVANQNKSVMWKIGVVLSRWDKDGSMAWDDGRILPAMLECAASHGISLQLISNTMLKENPNNFDKHIENSSFDGLIWFSMRADSAITAARLAGKGIFQIAVQSKPVNLSIPLVSEDNYKATYKATELLIREGHKNVLVINGEPEINSYIDRLKGVNQALADHKQKWPEQNFITIPESPHPQWLEAGIRDLIINIKPDAVISFCTLPDSILKCFGDIELIGFAPIDIQFAGKNGGMKENLKYRFFMPRFNEIGNEVIKLWIEYARAGASLYAKEKSIERLIYMDFYRYSATGNVEILTI